MYLLDTDILSNLMRRTPSTRLIVKVAAVSSEQQFTSSITLGELVYGAYRLGPHADMLLERLDSTLLPNLARTSIRCGCGAVLWPNKGGTGATRNSRGQRRSSDCRYCTHPWLYGGYRKRSPLPKSPGSSGRELVGVVRIIPFLSERSRLPLALNRADIMSRIASP
jgi:hypothetical protein